MSASVSDLQAAHRAILEEPFRDEWRLIYADALADQGRHFSASFLRDMVAGKTDDTIRYWFGPALPKEVTSHRVCKGFVSSVSMTCEAFERDAEQLFSSHPITEVILTDKSPLTNDHDNSARFFRASLIIQTFFGSDGGCDALPDPIWELLEGAGITVRHFIKIFDGGAAARSSLNRALVRYGRGLVRPPLPALVFPKPQEEEKAK